MGFLLTVVFSFKENTKDLLISDFVTLFDESEVSPVQLPLGVLYFGKNIKLVFMNEDKDPCNDQMLCRLFLRCEAEELYSSYRKILDKGVNVLGVAVVRNYFDAGVLYDGEVKNEVWFLSTALKILQAELKITKKLLYEKNMIEQTKNL